MADEKTKLVCLGDSIGTNYKLRVRSNTFSDLLGRRLGLQVCNHSTPATTAGLLLNQLQTDDKTAQEVKDAKIVLITAGSNNLLRSGMRYINEAAGIETSMRSVGKMIDAIKRNPAVTLKMIGAMNSQELKDSAAMHVSEYKADMEKLIDHIQEINSEAIIMVPTLYKLTDVSKSLIYKAFSKPTAVYFDEINGWIKTQLPPKGVLVLDLAEAFRQYEGEEDIANLKDNDFHLTDFGHLLTYRLLYERLIKDHPELSCEEGSDVIQERKRRQNWTRESGSYGSSKYSPIVREIIEKVSYEEIKDYDENKQFAQMGISPMEVFDMCRQIEKEVLDDKAEIPMPFSAYIRPTFFVDYLEGKLKPSIFTRLDTLPHYASAEEKAAAEKDDSATLKKFKDTIYGYLNDDMVVIDRNSTLLGTLDLDWLAWGTIIIRAQLVLNHPLTIAQTPDPENVTVGQIVDEVDGINRN